CARRNFRCHSRSGRSSSSMMFFTLAALFAPQWTQSVHSGDRHASSSQCWWIEAIGSCPFVPITSARICRPRRANKFRSACKKPITNRTRSGWKENERANRNSGERTRPAWWRARPRDRGLFFDVHNFRRVDTQAKFVSARLRNQHARRVRSPNMTTRWTRKDLLGLRELSADEINFVLDTANAFKQVGTRELRGKIAGLHVAIIGDILFSRVARSNIFGLLKLGARVTLVGPSTLVPHEFEKLGVEVSYRIDDVLPKADVVNLLRIQHERQR